MVQKIDSEDIGHLDCITVAIMTSIEAERK